MLGLPRKWNTLQTTHTWPRFNSAALSCGRRCFWNLEGGGGDSAVASAGEHLCLSGQIRAPLRHPHASRGSTLAPEQPPDGSICPPLTNVDCLCFPTGSPSSCLQRSLSVNSWSQLESASPCSSCPRTCTVSRGTKRCYWEVVGAAAVESIVESASVVLKTRRGLVVGFFCRCPGLSSCLRAGQQNTDRACTQRPIRLQDAACDRSRIAMGSSWTERPGSRPPSPSSRRRRSPAVVIRYPSRAVGTQRRRISLSLQQAQVSFVRSRCCLGRRWKLGVQLFV